MKQYLLIDIGGTFIKYSLADEQARKISGGKVPTPLTNMDDLLAVIEGFAAPLQGQFVGCAISMPGRIDTRNGIAHTGGMLSTFMWEQPFAAQVEARLGVPVTIANDGKCAAAAEGWTGALAGVENGLVLVLGTGGASQAVQYALAEAGIPYAVVSRDPARGNFLYDDLRPEVVAGHRLIVNATPVGTFPHVDEAPLLPYEALTAAHYLFDLVYNPERTQFLLRGERQGARTLNGLPMLEAQAEASWRIWNGVI